jgi:PQQ-dependent catabolism-associated CXXCW motif protein
MSPALATAAVASLLICAATAPAEPSDYRMHDYRSPTPATLRGAAVLSTPEAHAMWENRQAVFIDVLPRSPRPEGLPAATIWRPKPRADIPGSMWLPDTGYGVLAPRMEQYLAQNLHAATAGDQAHALVFYCQRDCWMSWNAAKRALSLGYAHVAWYPDGTDGWTEQSLPTEFREPEPRPPMTDQIGSSPAR